jgi:hypothetical protein
LALDLEIFPFKSKSFAKRRSVNFGRSPETPILSAFSRSARPWIPRLSLVAARAAAYDLRLFPREAAKTVSLAKTVKTDLNGRSNQS